MTEIGAFEALAHHSRRSILTLLRSEEAKPVGWLAERMPISRPAVSKHLRILRQAGLVSFESRGTSSLFRIRHEGFAPVKAYLDGFWDEALNNFKRLAES